jgi:hypothetical protein
MRDAAFGLAVTAGVTAILWLVWGEQALAPGGVFGVLATVIHVSAARLLRMGLGGSFARTLKYWGMGVALRLGGVVVFIWAVLARGDLFPPLPTAIAFLGVLLPTMASEVRLLR